MTKNGETNGFFVLDFVKIIEKYLKKKNILDYVIFNSKSFPKNLLNNYAKEKAFPVRINKKEEFKNKKTIFIPADVANHKNLIRHNPDKLAKLVLTVNELENVIRFIGRNN